jgi:hypothetical protein
MGCLLLLVLHSKLWTIREPAVCCWLLVVDTVLNVTDQPFLSDLRVSCSLQLIDDFTGF